MKTTFRTPKRTMKRARQLADALFKQIESEPDDVQIRVGTMILMKAIEGLDPTLVAKSVSVALENLTKH